MTDTTNFCRGSTKPRNVRTKDENKSKLADVVEAVNMWVVNTNSDILDDGNVPMVTMGHTHNYF